MGKRVKEVSLAEATPDTRAIYQRVFGDKDPVAQPGTSTGSPEITGPPSRWSLTSSSLVDRDRMGADGARTKACARAAELAILRTAIIGNCSSSTRNI